ncbi:MAG TPA: hypothetical protein VG146_21515, partial [Verrucomicrobiae bacterium]|nr:hypothetical protein [Verrucomicrobiae bacterium]
SMFPKGEPGFVHQSFGWAIECFTGHFNDYQPIDARYHDLEHSLQGTLCLARLLAGRHRAGANPAMSPRLSHLALLAILLHDTGYLKKRNDTEGTGAKYTVTHVQRSALFADELLSQKGFEPPAILAVQNMIRCTGINANLDAIPFQSDLEKVAGFSLATADLLGQMAAPDYIEKLPTLYAEFAEAVRFTPDAPHFIAGFTSARDLMQNTAEFWRKTVLPKLENQFLGLYRFLSVPYPGGPNDYLDRIEANIHRLEQHLSRMADTAA